MHVVRVLQVNGAHRIALPVTAREVATASQKTPSVILTTYRGSATGSVRSVAANERSSASRQRSATSNGEVCH